MKTELGVENSGMENRDKERDRRGRGARGSRFSDVDSNGGGSGAGKGNRDRSRERRNCRVYISNIPYDYRWQDLKDLFRRIVGSVEYVELFHDEMGKARGCGIVEFKDPDNVEKALEKMNRYEINGRELVVKEDHGEQRDQYGRIVRDGAGNAMMGGNVGGSGGGGGGNMRNDMSVGDRDRSFGRRDDDRISGRNNFNMMSNDFNSSSNYNLYGLSASFLESLGINGPLHNKVFVANLDYKVDNKKLKQVFKLAGKVQSVDLSVDKEGNSRGFAVVEFDHPVEAVQAISMLDRQMLYDRRMTVRLDRIPDKSEGLKLPEGLGGVGIGLGPNGEPLRDVARNLPNIINQQQPMLVGGAGGGIGNLPQNMTTSTQGMGNLPHGNANNLLGNLVANMGGGGQSGSGGNMGGGVFGNANVQPTPVAPVAPVVQTSAVKSQGGGGGTSSGNLSSLNLNNLSSSNLAALSNVVGLGAALSNPLLTSSLSNLGLNLGGGGQTGNDDNLSMTPAGNPLSNNYSTGGNNYSSNYGTPNYMSGGGNTSSSGGGGGGSSGVGNNTSSSAGNVGFNAYNSGGNNNGNGDNDYNTGSEMYNSGGGAGGGSGGNVRKSDSIIIRNLPLSCTWQTLRDKFRDVGEVKYAEIRGNDLGVVRFLKERDAELAIALMDGSRIDGRTIKVTYF